MSDPATSPLLISKSGGQTRRREGGPLVLNNRMLRMIEMMVYGHPDDPSGTQYSVYDAASAVGYRKKAARDLGKSPVFMQAFNKELQALRNNEAARSIKTLIEIRDEKGENRAADRKVRLQAAQVLMGEGAEGRRGTNVSVNVQNVVQPGYVLDLTPQTRTFDERAALRRLAGPDRNPHRGRT